MLVCSHCIYHHLLWPCETRCCILKKVRFWLQRWCSGYFDLRDKVCTKATEKKRKVHNVCLIQNVVNQQSSCFFCFAAFGYIVYLDWWITFGLKILILVKLFGYFKTGGRVMLDSLHRLLTSWLRWRSFRLTVLNITVVLLLWQRDTTLLNSVQYRLVKWPKKKTLRIIPRIHHEVEKISNLQIRLWHSVCKNRKRQGEYAKGKLDSGEEGNFLRMSSRLGWGNKLCHKAHSVRFLSTSSSNCGDENLNGNQQLTHTHLISPWSVFPCLRCKVCSVDKDVIVWWWGNGIVLE